MPTPTRFVIAYRPDPYAFALWLVVAFGIVSTSTLWVNRMARHVDATCTWEVKSDRVVPKCLVRTTGLLSSQQATVYPTIGTYSAIWIAFAESAWNRRSLRSLLLGDRVEFPIGCGTGDWLLLSEAPSGTRREVDDAVAELNRFFAEKRPEVRISYGPWGVHPLVFVLPFSLAAAAVVAGARRGGRRIVVTVDESKQTVVIENAFGPLRFERRDYLATGVTRCTVGEERARQYFVELVLRSGQRIRLCVETGPRGVQEQFAARVEASLERARAPSDGDRFLRPLGN